MSQPERVESQRGRADPHREGASIRIIIAIVVVGLPLIVFLSAWLLIVATNNLDLAFRLRVPETVLDASLLAIAGMIVGVAAAVAAALQNWRVLAPPVAGIAAGVGIYLLPGLATRHGDTTQS